MALPPSFLQHVEQHPCFTGCYGQASGVQVCLDPNKPLSPLVVVSCRDCYAQFAVPASMLPAGVTAANLSSQLTQHMQARRGFALSVSGYYTNGPGFWFSAVYYACGLFLIHGERSRTIGTDLDQLMHAFRQGVLTPPDPRMLDPKQFAVQTLYVNFASAAGGMSSKQGLLSSPLVRTQATAGWQKVTLAEFLPLVGAPKASAASATPAAKGNAVARPPLKLGDICPVCGSEVRERQLLHTTYIGCRC